MEGLLIAEELAKLELPSKRLAWRFPDAHTFVLPLSSGSLWLLNRPPHPRLAYRRETPAPTGTRSSFQDLLASRAAGPLLAAEQLKLDRVVKLRFGPDEGFAPTPGVTLVAELTGRNCNLILTDEGGTVIGAAREVGGEVNRFRQVRSGLPYQPPPPYDKLDPRTASDEALRAALSGQRIKKLRAVLDGVGPELSEALAISSGLSPDAKLGEPELGRLLPALRRLLESPSLLMKEALGLPDLDELRQGEARTSRLEQLRAALGKERLLLQNRLEDVEKARVAALEAQGLRAQADVLLAYQHLTPKNAAEVTLTDFSGEPLTIKLEPRLSAVENAQAMFERARKRENRRVQAEAREAELKSSAAELDALLADLEDSSDAELAELLGRYRPAEKTQGRLEIGIRYQGPHGFRVIVGRSARENEVVTFKLAKSRDLWLHVQGYTGSHVIIQAENDEVPFDTVLFAAQLAAAYSKAAQSDNVPVDYTLRKNVWKPKGAAPGAVHYSQQKTVYVTPSRRPAQVE